MGYQRLAFLLLILCVIGSMFILSCGDDDDDDDEGPEGGDSDHDARYGWVVGNATDDSATALYTENGGDNWTLISSDIPPADLMAVSAVDKHIAWIVGNKWVGDKKDDVEYATIFHTTDKGKTWHRQGDEQVLADRDLNGVSAVDDNTTWVVGSHGLILKTVDGGVTWDQQGDGQIPDVTLAKVDAVDGQTAWIISDNYGFDYASIFRTTDGGENWDEFDFPDKPSMNFIDLSAIDANIAWAVGPNGEDGWGHAHRTTDGGATWDHWDLPIAFYHANGVCALDENTAYVATDQGQMFYTTNGGDDWGEISPSPDQVPGISGFELMGVVTKDGQSIWAAALEFGGSDDGLIIHSSDGGANWQAQDIPVSGITLSRLSFVGACK